MGTSISATFLAIASMTGSIERTILNWWEGFVQVFVGEDLIIQLAVILSALLLCAFLAFALKPMFRRITEAIEERDDWIEDTVDWLAGNLFRLLLVGTLWSASLWFDARNAGYPVAVEMEPVSATDDALELDAGEPVLPVAYEKNYILIRALASLATLWLLSGGLPAGMKDLVFYKILYFVFATVLALNLLGVWSVISEGLQGIRLLPISGSTETRVTVLSLLKGALAVLILIPLATWVMRSSERRLGRMSSVSPRLQVLSVKLIKALVVAGAALFAVSAVGIDLSAFAVLGGAIGLGLGFGFQKVVSNLVSGVILLGDKSIKPGDVIEVDDTYGWINTLGARYTSVITRDGTEHLIPNEMMITEKVVNWSFSDDKVRLKVPFGVAYRSDLRKVMALTKAVAQDHDRVLEGPAPVVRVMGFGDSSVDFELRVWIRDPEGGVNNIRSDLYLGIWDAFQENDIEIPFPQRDLHIRDSKAIPFRSER